MSYREWWLEVVGQDLAGLDQEGEEGQQHVPLRLLALRHTVQKLHSQKRKKESAQARHIDKMILQRPQQKSTQAPHDTSPSTPPRERTTRAAVSPACSLGMPLSMESSASLSSFCSRYSLMRHLIRFSALSRGNGVDVAGDTRYI